MFVHSLIDCLVGCLSWALVPSPTISFSHSFGIMGHCVDRRAFYPYFTKELCVCENKLGCGKDSGNTRGSSGRHAYGVVWVSYLFSFLTPIQSALLLFSTRWPAWQSLTHPTRLKGRWVLCDFQSGLYFTTSRLLTPTTSVSVLSLCQPQIVNVQLRVTFETLNGPCLPFMEVWLWVPPQLSCEIIKLCAHHLGYKLSSMILGPPQMQKYTPLSLLFLTVRWWILHL